MAQSIADLTAIQEVVGRINQLTEQSQRQWGSMSVNLMITHCADQIKICLEEKPAKMFGNKITQAISRFLFFKVGMKFPKNARTLPELDPNKNLMTKPDLFAKDRQELIALVEKFFDLPKSRMFSHPLLGKATKDEIGKLIYLHLDHHLRQFGV